MKILWKPYEFEMKKSSLSWETMGYESRVLKKFMGHEIHSGDFQGN